MQVREKLRVGCEPPNRGRHVDGQFGTRDPVDIARGRSGMWRSVWARTLSREASTRTLGKTVNQGGITVTDRHLQHQGKTKTNRHKRTPNTKAQVRTNKTKWHGHGQTQTKHVYWWTNTDKQMQAWTDKAVERQTQGHTNISKDTNEHRGSNANKQKTIQRWKHPTMRTSCCKIQSTNWSDKEKTTHFSACFDRQAHAERVCGQRLHCGKILWRTFLALVSSDTDGKVIAADFFSCSPRLMNRRDHTSGSSSIITIQPKPALNVTPTRATILGHSFNGVRGSKFSPCQRTNAFNAQRGTPGTVMAWQVLLETGGWAPTNKCVWQRSFSTPAQARSCLRDQAFAKKKRRLALFDVS